MEGQIKSGVVISLGNINEHIQNQVAEFEKRI